VRAAAVDDMAGVSGEALLVPVHLQLSEPVLVCVDSVMCVCALVGVSGVDSRQEDVVVGHGLI
jgi:hypothetical protein